MNLDYDKIESELYDIYQAIDAVGLKTTERVLSAMRNNKLSDRHFAWRTGYGYDDDGRDIIESIYAEVFGAEAALVRTQIVSGTHAISLALRSVIQPGKNMVSATGLPYDTMMKTLGLVGDSPISLKARGSEFIPVELDENHRIRVDAVLSKIDENTQAVYVQRSSGYSFRRAIDMAQIKVLVERVKALNPDLLVIVDNCYGEFVEELEPCHVGCDLAMGSLIKNPGGGLALSGGYIVGREDLIELCAENLTAPGLGKELGLSFGMGRSMLQGLFIAPSVVAGAVKGAVFAAKLYEKAGFKVCPSAEDFRSDIIQSIELGSEENLLEFCKVLQATSPVEAYVQPVPGPLPGYNTDVIMAAGTFVQGASIELSADAPVKEPYIVYLQGGLSYFHAKLAAIKTFEAIVK